VGDGVARRHTEDVRSSHRRDRQVEIRVRRMHRRDINRVWEFLKLVFRGVTAG
jgi:hypothetical protein